MDTQALYPSLRGKTALVTGAARGLGLASSHQLARSGVKVCLVDIDEAHLQDVHALITQEGGQAMSMVADITDEERMDAVAREIVDTYGGVDIVFANAGINGKWTGIDNFEPGEWERTIHINLVGTYQTIRCVTPMMKEADRGGSIVITASINGYRTFSNTGASAYAASKAGQVALAQMLALELAKHKIRVNVICPGSIKSSIGESTILANKDIREPVIFPDGEIPLTYKKPGTGDDVADLVCFLASEQSRHITGAVITIDGAQSLLLG